MAKQLSDKQLFTVIKGFAKFLQADAAHRQRLANDPDYAASVHAQDHRALEAEKAEIAASTAQERADAEFRADVIEELVASGIAPHVAANLTNTMPKLMAKAKEIGFI